MSLSCCESHKITSRIGCSAVLLYRCGDRGIHAVENGPGTASAFPQFISFRGESLQNASGSSGVTLPCLPSFALLKKKGCSSHWNGNRCLYYSLAIMSHLLQHTFVSYSVLRGRER